MKQSLYKQNEIENNTVLYSKMGDANYMPFVKSRFLILNSKHLRVAVFRISGVWHVGWWNLITSVRLMQVGNNRNDHFRYLLGVRVHLIEVSFKVNEENKFGVFG